MDIYKKLPTDLQKIIDKMIFQMNYSEMIDDLKNRIIFHYWCIIVSNVKLVYIVVMNVMFIEPHACIIVMTVLKMFEK